MNNRHYSFADDTWKKDLVQAYSFRFSETPDFTQAADHITTAVNPSHREGYDNISLLSPEIYSAGVQACLRCSFDGLGCPEIILVKQPERCDDGAVRYGECFEIVLWKNGVNVWRMNFIDGKVTWKKALGVEFPVSADEIHTLTVDVLENVLKIDADGKKMHLYVNDLYPEFHLGLDACEGIQRFYDMTIEKIEG